MTWEERASCPELPRRGSRRSWMVSLVGVCMWEDLLEDVDLAAGGLDTLLLGLGQLLDVAVERVLMLLAG